MKKAMSAEWNTSWNKKEESMDFNDICKRYTTGEEVLNAVSHGVGALFAIVGTTLMVAAAALQQDWYKLAATIIYGCSLMLLYVMSTLYHSFTTRRVKEIFRIFDHCSIFLLIAGTYTPFTLVSLRQSTGWYLFAFIWISTVVGIILNAISIERFKYFSMVCYVVMGWSVLITIRPLIEMLTTTGLLLLVAGGLFYTVGIVFYAMKKKRYMHGIWHFFVLFGSICHYLCILWFVIL